MICVDVLHTDASLSPYNSTYIMCVSAVKRMLKLTDTRRFLIKLSSDVNILTEYDPVVDLTCLHEHGY